MARSPDTYLEPSAVTGMNWGWLLPPAHYRHPGDLIRLITAGLVLAGMLAVIVAAHGIYAGASAAMTALATSTLPGQVLAGLVEAAFAVAAAAAVAVTVRSRRFRLLATRGAGLAVVAGAAAAGVCMKRHAILRAACVGLAVALAACTSSSGHVSPTAGGQASRPGRVITVGSFDFPESVLLAEIYGQALAAARFPVRILPNLGPREVVDPALVDGLLQLVPEYAGSALDFFSLGRRFATSNSGAANRALAESVAGRGLVAARPAPAQDTNAIVVTAATAARYGLRSIADLAKVAPGLTFGGPPECPGRAYCLPGLKRVYGLRFKAFTPLDAGGPLTLQALAAGYIGVALLFTTDPNIPARHLVVLADDRGLQPAENITPLLRRNVLARYGPNLIAVLNRVSALLGTGTLRALDARVELKKQNPRLVASSWLHAHGLIPAGGGRP